MNIIAIEWGDKHRLVGDDRFLKDLPEFLDTPSTFRRRGRKELALIVSHCTIDMHEDKAYIDTIRSYAQDNDYWISTLTGSWHYTDMGLMLVFSPDLGLITRLNGCGPWPLSGSLERAS